VKGAFDAYRTDASDPAKTSAAVQALQAGRDPDTGKDICLGPTYGCGAHVAAKAPPLDRSAALYALGAALTGGAWLRRRQLGLHV